MNFDIKDVKSWANRHDVKVGDKGYFSNRIDFLEDKNIDQLSKLDLIYDNRADCFSAKDFYKTFDFFLPLDAVKDEQKEKKYRPFKTIREIEDTLNKNVNVHQAICVGEDIFLRYKENKNLIKHLLITNIDKDINTKEVSLINTFSPQDLFNMFEIRLSGKWLPFGVEVEDDEG